MGIVARYPGPQPFSDDETSRLVFCGRDEDAESLRNLVLAHRLSVLYAKSGLGKTSLLRAGLAEKLRTEGFLPLIVRVNDTKRTPLAGLLSDIEREAHRQGVEFQAGNPLSLWHYFKTVEFWRGDLLLTPVLILDQFEELFTLQKPGGRHKFIADLGSLIRGGRPWLKESGVAGEPPELTEKAPDVHVLISLREDFVGQLEEAAESIPDILDHRFRLTPLDDDAAAKAIGAPAEIEDERFSTRPFRYGEGTIAAIVAFLSRRTDDVDSGSRSHAEPVHLQLICRRAERVAAERQIHGRAAVVTLGDLGGVAGLTKVLEDFYTDVVNSLPNRGVRRAVRRLCTFHLISPSGRRLSVEQGEIAEQLKLKAATLQDLVDRRLLRSDQRADRSYFELSHDSLVAPILAAGRLRAEVVGMAQLFGSVLVGLVGLVVLVVVTLQSDPITFKTRLLFGAPFAAFALWLFAVAARQGAQTLRRFSGFPMFARVICAYGAYVVIERVFFGAVPVLPESTRALHASVAILGWTRGTAMIAGSVALFKLRPKTAFLFFAAGLACTVGTSILGLDHYFRQNALADLVIGSVVPISLEAMILVYVRRLGWPRLSNRAGSASIPPVSGE